MNTTNDLSNEKVIPILGFVFITLPLIFVGLIVKLLGTVLSLCHPILWTWWKPHFEGLG